MSSPIGSLALVVIPLVTIFTFGSCSIIRVPSVAVDNDDYVYEYYDYATNLQPEQPPSSKFSIDVLYFVVCLATSLFHFFFFFLNTHSMC
jgi:hypothetical protein